MNINYPNKIKVVDALKNARCWGGIMLEPRLQEFIKKKRFYRKNNIKPCIKPEAEFQITRADKLRIKAFLKGRKDIYTPKFNKKVELKFTKKPSKQYFPSKAYRNSDNRVPILASQDKNKNVPNMGMFALEQGESYYHGQINKDNPLMDTRDMNVNNIKKNQFMWDNGGFKLNDSRFDPRTDPRMFPGYEEFNKHESQFRIDPKERKYYKKKLFNKHSNHFDKLPDMKCPQNKNIGTNYSCSVNSNQFSFDRHPSDNKFKDNRNDYVISDLGYNAEDMNKYHGINKMSSNYSTINSNDSKMYAKNDRLIENFDEVFKNDKRYGNLNSEVYSQKSEMDTELKIVIPTIKSKKDSLNTAAYQAMPYIGNGTGPGPSNAELESTMILGMPTRTQKSYGYRNPYENYFQYVDEDFVNPDNSVMNFPRSGIATRNFNKTEARRTHTRDFSKLNV